MNPVPFFLLALLWLAHGLVDRLGVSEERARQTGSTALWAAHAFQITALGGALLLFGLTRLRFSSQPMPPSPAELGALALSVGLGHLAIDRIQTRLGEAARPSPLSDAFDQLAHLLLAVGLVWGLSLRHPEWSQLGSGPILILGQPVELLRFSKMLLYGALLVWIIGEAVRRPLSPRLAAALVAERALLAAAILAGPLWLTAILLGGRLGFARWRSEPPTVAIPSVVVALMATIFRGLLAGV